MSKYSQELKQAVLMCMMLPESRSVAALSRETGITETTLYNWRNVSQTSGGTLVLHADNGSPMKSATLLTVAGRNALN